jgi:hypothetical protein
LERPTGQVAALHSDEADHAVPKINLLPLLKKSSLSVPAVVRNDKHVLQGNRKLSEVFFVTVELKKALADVLLFIDFAAGRPVGLLELHAHKC